MNVVLLSSKATATLYLLDLFGISMYIILWYSYPYRSICFCITIVSDAEGHALSTPLLPEGHESGLRDLSDDGGQVILAAAVVAWRSGLGVSVSTVTASDHRLTLEEIKVWSVDGETKSTYNIEISILAASVYLKFMSW